VVAGASTTAVLALMAAYGIADARASTPAPDLAAGGTLDPSPAPPAPTAAPAPLGEFAPQVVLVVVDGATGRVLSSTAVAGHEDPVATTVTPTVATAPMDRTSATTTGPDHTPSDPSGEPRPTLVPVTPALTVDLAVPAPPPVHRPAPAETVAAPAPQATSSGS
jgi:hypothetical protein